MKYKSVYIPLSFSKNNGSWEMFMRNKEKKTMLIEWLRLVPRFVFGQLVGIKEILVNR